MDVKQERRMKTARLGLRDVDSNRIVREGSNKMITFKHSYLKARGCHIEISGTSVQAGEM